ncbi:hypothetical protein ABEG17_12685 [Pedococcus sp. KACC 23699]|uniref:Uncharacterized protein n=1 Tax=Pedococcus sp. KACC 23699 TaxID=3149228 RepID=A0AAU7JQC7_9MICO
MGDFAQWSGRRTVAVLVVALVALAAVALAVLRPSAHDAFESWLRDQPEVVSVEPTGQALAAGPRTVAARVFEPSLVARLRVPVEPAVVDRLGRAIVGYAADHPDVNGSTVEVRQRSDAALLGTRPGPNATTVQQLRALRAIPSAVSVQATAQSGMAPFTVTVPAGTDLPGTAATLARTLPPFGTAWFTSPSTGAARDGAGHEVRVVVGATVTATAASAFAQAVATSPSHPVTLVVSTGSDGHDRSVLDVGSSPDAAAIAAAVHRSGFGLSSRDEVVEGPTGPLLMDETAWAAAAGAALTRVGGVLTATIDPGSAADRKPVRADLRVRPEVSLDSVLRALPAPVERVEVHTSAAAPDYDRDDALVPDPEVDCPAGPHGPDLAYTGPRDRLPAATSYLAALRSATSGATCVHWAEASTNGRPTTQMLLVRLPLQATSWQPVLDVVRARHANPGSARPRVILLLPVPGSRVTAMFTLPEGGDPYVTTLDAQTQAQTSDAEAALQPLVRYWTRG